MPCQNGRCEMKRRNAAVCAIVAFALCSCSGAAGKHGSYGTGDPSLAAANPGGGSIDPFLSNGDAVLQAIAAIEARAGKPLRITSINADQMNGLTVDVQEPAKHTNVDRFVVAPDGAISGPAPVRLMSLSGGPITAADVDRRAFDVHAIAFGRLTQTIRAAIAKSGYPDARVIEWEFGGIGPDDRKYIYFESARARPVAVVTPQLTIVRMQY